MNWEYISGFFDADGSITMCRINGYKHKTIQVSFSNNELNILLEIQRFIKKELNVNGRISKKKIVKDTHSQNYDLRYVYRNGYLVSKHLNSKHVKKMHRIKVYEKIQNLIPRNGKYTEDELEKRNILDQEFFATPCTSTALQTA